MMDIEEKKQRASDYVRMMGDPARRPQALDMMADDATWWMPILGTWDKTQLRDGMADADKRFTSAVDITIHGITAEGDRVAVEAESRVGVINGKTYNNRYHFLIVFRGDKISRVMEYCDIKTAEIAFEGLGYDV
jgi:uncharacterized protein